jgi:hypothetical protein
VGNAVNILQRLLREMGHDIGVDGAIGPQTIRAAEILAKQAPKHLPDAYGIARRNYYFRLADRRIASRKYGRTRAGGKGGLIGSVFDLLFGNGRNVVRETVEVFRENAENGAAREAEVRGQALAQFGAEFSPPKRGMFDRVMDAVNRIPLPALALGTLGMFISAMVDPVWFGERMQGIALVPEPLWWLLGRLCRSILARVIKQKARIFNAQLRLQWPMCPLVVRNIRAMRALEAGSVGVANSGTDARLAIETLAADPNPALVDWQQNRAGDFR